MHFSDKFLIVSVYVFAKILTSSTYVAQEHEPKFITRGRFFLDIESRVFSTLLSRSCSDGFGAFSPYFALLN